MRINKVIAIDPGTTQSAFVIMRNGEIDSFGIEENSNILDMLYEIADSAQDPDDTHLVVEMIASYGMPVGSEVFETCVWIGRFIEAWGGGHEKIYRKDVKINLCGSTKAKDSNIRQALLDRYGPGKAAAIGRKAAPGPLYGFKSDEWAALAVACTYLDKQTSKNQ